MLSHLCGQQNKFLTPTGYEGSDYQQTMLPPTMTSEFSVINTRTFFFFW